MKLRSIYLKKQKKNNNSPCLELKEQELGEMEARKIIQIQDSFIKIKIQNNHNCSKLEVIKKVQDQLLQLKNLKQMEK